MIAPAAASEIVIVGAGLAGGNVAVTLREEGFRGRIVLIGREPTLPFGRPPLSKTYLRGEEDLDDWRVKPADWYDGHDIECRLETAVRQIDTVARHMLLGDGEMLSFDRLVLCTGGRPRRPRIAGVDLPGVQVLRTVADCEAIKGAVRPGVKMVVVGMGFIGSEVAASLRQMDVDVTAVLGEASPLERVLGEEVGAVMATIHREHGVRLIAGDHVARFEGSGVLERAVTEAGVTLDCEMAVIGAGIEPDLEALEATPLALQNGILVDAQCRTSVENVYAAGDVANQLHPLFGRVRVEHYNSAEKMGRAVARVVLGDEAPYDYLHSFWSDQYEHKLEYVGHASRWESFVVRGDLRAKSFLGFYLEGGVIRAVVGLNRGGDPELDEDDELHACQKLIAQRAAPPSGALSDEGVDLHDLLTS